MIEQPEPDRIRGSAPSGAAKDMFVGQVREFARAIAGEPNRSPDAYDGGICVAAIEAAYQAAETDRTVEIGFTTPGRRQMTATPMLKDLLGRGKPVWIMGAHDVVSAKIVEDAGFDAVGIQSLQLAMVDGLPDIGLITPDYVVDLCRRVRRAVDIPIVVDFEQGFGEPYAAVHWMKEFEAAGVSAVHIDDYGLPYKCTFFPPHTMGLESVDETAAKIRAMVTERSNPDFMVIGRPGTYVATVHDTEEERRRDWLARAERYVEAGVGRPVRHLPDGGVGQVFQAGGGRTAHDDQDSRHRDARRDLPLRRADCRVVDRRDIQAGLRDVHRTDDAARSCDQRYGRGRGLRQGNGQIGFGVGRAWRVATVADAVGRRGNPCPIHPAVLHRRLTSSGSAGRRRNR